MFDSFYNNFIAEDRYRMILDGLQVTLLITAGAVVLGTLLLFSAMGHPFQQFAEMISRSSVTSGSSLVWRRTDFRMLS